MAQFDVYKNPNPDTNGSIPYLLDVQSEVLSSLTTRVVVPLLTPSAMGRAAELLNPRFEIEGMLVVMSTAELAGVSVQLFGEKVGSLKDQRDEIIGAIEFLFTGF